MPRTISRSQTKADIGDGKLWMLLISVHEYDDRRLSLLPYGTIDGQELASVLTEATQAFSARSIDIHHDCAAKLPTLSAVRDSLQTIADQGQPQDTVLFYFCGHGALESRLQQAVLCLADTEKDSLLKTGLTMMTLLGLLGRCAAKRQVVWLDTCHSGGMLNLSEPQSEPLDDPTLQLSEMLRKHAAQNPGFEALLSCDRFQRSWKFPELGHGIFNYFLMQGLRGEAADAEGVIDTEALSNYVYHQTLHYIEQTNQKIRQINHQKQDWEDLQPEYSLQTPKRIAASNQKCTLAIQPTGGLEPPIAPNVEQTTLESPNDRPPAPQDVVELPQPESRQFKLPQAWMKSIVSEQESNLRLGDDRTSPPPPPPIDVSIQQQQREQAEAERRLKQRQEREQAEADRQRQTQLREQAEAERRLKQAQQREQAKADRQRQTQLRKQAEAERRLRDNQQREQAEAERQRQTQLREQAEAERRLRDNQQREQAEAERQRQSQLREQAEADRRLKQAQQREQAEAERQRQTQLREQAEADRRLKQTQLREQAEAERQRQTQLREQAEAERRLRDNQQREQAEADRRLKQTQLREQAEAERQRQTQLREQAEAERQQQTQLRKQAEAERRLKQAQQREHAKADRRRKQHQHIAEIKRSTLQFANQQAATIDQLRRSTVGLTRRISNQQRNPRVRKIMVIAMSGVGLSAIGLAAFSTYQHRNAQIREIKALSARSDTLLSANQPRQALAVALKAAHQLQSLDRPWNLLPEPLKIRTIATLQQAIMQTQDPPLEKQRPPIAPIPSNSESANPELSNPGGSNPVTLSAIASSADGQWLATADSTNTITLSKRDDRGRQDPQRPKTLRGHTATITQLQFSPDGQRLASASADKTIKLWNVDKGILIKTLVGHRDRITAIGFRPDGEVLASGSADQTIKLWTIPNGELADTFKGIIATTIRFSPDGRILAAGSSDNTIRLWYPDSNQPILLGRHDLMITDLVFSADGKTIASASWDKTIKLWKVDDAKFDRESSPYRTLTGHTGGVTSISFNPGGHILASGSQDTTISLWDTQDGKVLKTLLGHQDAVKTTLFSTDGSKLISTSDRTGMIVWNLNLTDLLQQGCDQIRQPDRHSTTQPLENPSHNDSQVAANNAIDNAEEICSTSRP